MERWAHRVLLSLLLLFGLLLPMMAEADGWADYKQRFLRPEGRIVDNGNRNISHTEGQGTAMLLAVFNDDRATFELLWRWTKTTLYQPKTGLFSWRYDPNANPAVNDKNNATDGDTLIAWALLEAGKKWQLPDYIQRSRKIQNALLQYNVVTFAGYQVMLPGIQGFKTPTHLTINPSYFIFPAWQAFYENSYQQVWLTLSTDGMALVEKMRFGLLELPTDWVSLSSDGSVEPAEKWPPQFGFDAIRIPLYLYWRNADSPLLAPFSHLWRTQSQPAPAWIDVSNNSKANFSQSVGAQAISQLITANTQLLSDSLGEKEDYYSASLHLLTYWAAQR